MEAAVAPSDCSSVTQKYYQEKAFSTCHNLLAGHDVYFAPNCPISTPRMCIEPTPPGFHSINDSSYYNRSHVPPFFPDDEKIAFANMTAVRDRINLRGKSKVGKSMDCLKCWDYFKQKDLWSKYVDRIESVIGAKFVGGNIKTVLEFGCGTGGFLAEMATRGVVGICTARDISKDRGETSELPYLRTVASRGLIAMHIPITEHQPFLSSTFNFIHCSWVLAYVEAYPEVYTSILIEWDRLLTPGGLVVQQGAWTNMSVNVDELYAFVKYLLESVLQWKIITWEISEQRRLGKVLDFIAITPLQRESKDWTKDKTLLNGCPKCFQVTIPQVQRKKIMRNLSSR